MNASKNAKISLGEGITTEFKLATNTLPKNLFETVVAFLNRYGGTIFLGVSDAGEIIGIPKENISKLKKDFVTQCNNEEILFPTIRLEIKECVIDEKVILVIEVPNSTEVHRSKGRYYDRNEDGDFDVTRSTGIVFRMYQRKSKIHYEDEIIPELTMDDFSDETFELLRRLAIGRDETHPWRNLTNEEILKSSDLYRETIEQKGFTIGALLLFGKNKRITHWISHYRTDAIYLDKNMDRYDDRDFITENLIDSYQRLFQFAQKHTDDHFYLNEEMLRESPRDWMIREVISNLLIHRDFSNSITSRMIITKDKLYTENPSCSNMSGVISLEHCIPNSKNPHIARIFREIHYADELGSGIRNLTKYVQIYCGEEPILEEGEILAQRFL